MTSEREQGKVQNYYETGMYYFGLGLLDRALENFLKVASMDYAYPDVLNNAGVILLYKGRFKEAYRLFKINAYENYDSDARSFLKELPEVNRFAVRYNRAVELIGEGRYKEAGAILEEESKLGFSTENGNVLQCIMHYINGDFRKCRRMLEIIHRMDKGSVFYLKMLKALDERKENPGKVQYALISGVVGLGILALYLGYKLSLKPAEVVRYQTIEKEVVRYLEKEAKPKTPSEILGDLKRYARDENWYEFEKVKPKLDYKSLNTSDKKAFDSINNQFTNVAEEYFYGKGLKYFKDKNYQPGHEYLSLAYKYKNNSFLDQHVVFMAAKASNAVKDPDTLKLYEEYITSYKDGCYIQEALYDAALIYYTKKDIQKAKAYALRISQDYKDSQYNNGKIKEIIGK